jgi:hypothetical protein
MRLPIVLALAIMLSVGLADAAERSASAKSEFKRENPCPSGGGSGGCSGYQIDHRQPLAAGGVDHKSNMQWLSVDDHKAKTKYERHTCTYGCGSKGGYSYKPSSRSKASK